MSGLNMIVENVKYVPFDHVTGFLCSTLLKYRSCYWCILSLIMSHATRWRGSCFRVVGKSQAGINTSKHGSGSSAPSGLLILQAMYIHFTHAACECESSAAEIWLREAWLTQNTPSLALTGGSEISIYPSYSLSLSLSLKPARHYKCKPGFGKSRESKGCLPSPLPQCILCICRFLSRLCRLRKFTFNQ